ncbi:hypothetical protein [Paenibacillus sp. IITD108]|uniref:hypothetical protein n=1 Tax=Paenibacillus sp. IITD108 TaxID=3116649 RepID=UPI002F3F7C69
MNEKLPQGLYVTVLRNSTGDSTNGGITSIKDRILLVGDGVPAVAQAEENEPYLILKERAGRLYAVPSSQDSNTWWMMGGNFVYTSDSRYHRLCNYPIPVHDRQENNNTIKEQLLPDITRKEAARLLYSLQAMKTSLILRLNNGEDVETIKNEMSDMFLEMQKSIVQGVDNFTLRYRELFDKLRK